MSYPDAVDLIMGTCVGAGFADHNFSEPASLYSPASFTEGDASQAIRPAGNAFAMGSVAVSDVPGCNPLEGRGSEMTRPLEVSQVPKRKKKVHTQKKKDQIVFECLEEGGVRGKGEEPDTVSGDETSSAAEPVLNLPSSSGTTVLSDEEADSVLPQQVDCNDGEEVPPRPTSVEQVLSPQTLLLNSRAAPEDQIQLVCDVGAADVMTSQGKQHPPEVENSDIHKRIGVEAKQIDSTVEISGSKCLEGRNANQRDSTQDQVINRA